jgi:hypothetical protein
VFNVREIVHNNNATFYDFDSEVPQNQNTRYLITLLIALFAALFFSKISDNLLAGFLAVQSILLGFSINIMFFLVSNREGIKTKHHSLESELRSQRLNKLYHELFYNVSYFNLIAIGSIIIAVMLLLPVPEIPNFLRGNAVVDIYQGWLNTSSVPDLLKAVLHGCAMLVFYAMTIEVMFSISRVIGRTSFYFERKMREVKQSDSIDQL